jgi:hypothetical protein
MLHFTDPDRKASVNRLAPELWSCRDVLYVGARTDRIDFGQELREASVAISVLEIYPPNVEYLRTLDWIAEVFAGDVRTFEPTKQYDAAFWWHGPEHIPARDLPGALARLEKAARKLVVLGCPWGKYKQGKLHDNPNEQHVSHFDYDTFEKLGYEVECLGVKNVPGSNITAVKRLS